MRYVEVMRSTNNHPYHHIRLVFCVDAEIVEIHEIARITPKWIRKIEEHVATTVVAEAEANGG